MGISDRERFTAALGSRHTLMFAHIFDMAEQSEKQSRSIYGDFLSENSISTLLCRKQYLPLEPILFGGVEDAERQMVAFVSPYDEPAFPISAVAVTSHSIAALSHRDFLGSVLGLGIKREKCGDIIILEDACYILMQSDIASFVASSLTKVGRVGVRCSVIDTADIRLPEKSFTPVTGTVASLRLDSIVSLMAGKGRSKSTELIAAGFVFVDGVLISKNDFHLSGGETISVRGCGKAILEIGGKSKKDRIFVTLNKFS